MKKWNLFFTTMCTKPTMINWIGLTIFILSPYLHEFWLVTLNCDPLSFKADWSTTPELYETWLNSLPENFWEDLEKMCNETDDDFDEQSIDVYHQYRFELFWDSLTPEQQAELYDHNLIKTRILGGIVILLFSIFAWYTDDIK